MKLEEVMEVQYFKAGLNYAAAAAGAKQQQSEENLQSRMKEVFIDQAQKAELIRLLTAQPGAERILRTGTPVPVPPVCCTED